MLAEMDIEKIGITIVCLLYIIKMMWEGFMKMKTPKDNNQLLKTDFYDMKQQVKDLHIWHDKEDENGSKVWYVKTSLEKAIHENTTAINNLEDTIKALDS